MTRGDKSVGMGYRVTLHSKIFGMHINVRENIVFANNFWHKCVWKVCPLFAQGSWLPRMKASKKEDAPSARFCVKNIIFFLIVCPYVQTN